MTRCPARLIARAGSRRYIGGSAMLAARHGLPDLGLAALGEMVAGVRDILDATALPCLVDADDGYGDVKSVVNTIEAYERIGAAGALLEDQLSAPASSPAPTRRGGVAPIEVIEQKAARGHGGAPRPRFRHHRPHRRRRRRGAGRGAAARRAVSPPGRRRRFSSRGCGSPRSSPVGAAFKGSWNAAVMFGGRPHPWMAAVGAPRDGVHQVSYPK